MKNTPVARRPRRSAAQWAKIVAEAESTSLPLSEFCEQNEMSLAAFQQWRRRLRSQQKEQSLVQPAFLPVRVQTRDTVAGGTNAGSHIDIILANGRLLRVTEGVDAAHLCRVVDALEGSRPC